jgi:hypothetical protein
VVTLYASLISLLASAIRIQEKNAIARSLHALFDPADLLNALKNLGDLEQRVDIEAANCSREVTQRVYQGMVEGHSKLQAILTEQLVRVYGSVTNMSDHLNEGQRCDVLRWICNIPYRTDHQNACSGRIPGTGQWLLSHPIFKEWRESSASMILWLHGIRE